MTTQTLTKKDFVSDQEIRWCPGCGDYGILSAVQKSLATLDIPKENFVFVSGIGCSSRFPYYMNTYGFHTIHGRAPAFATGLKITNPSLSVWVITGDGDGLSIGGNHLVHAIRRNMDIHIILFNNEIYGLTKGQFSPTTEFGTVTKSTPFGTIDNPLKPLSVAIASEATFVARTYDRNQKHLSEIFERAARHKGTSFVEVLQNCIIFNDGAHEAVVGKEHRDNTALHIEHGKPLLFGNDKKKGISIEGFKARIVDVNQEGLDAVTVHDETIYSPDYAFLLSRMSNPDFPVPMGVLRAVEKPCYEDLIHEQIAKVKASKGEGNIHDLIYSGDLWDVQ
jgi:2-oxoglutarate/2-oxoacid ferredoxin oxidoreductase subunit beta